MGMRMDAIWGLARLESQVEFAASGALCQRKRRASRHAGTTTPRRGTGCDGAIAARARCLDVEAHGRGRNPAHSESGASDAPGLRAYAAAAAAQAEEMTDGEKGSAAVKGFEDGTGTAHSAMSTIRAHVRT